MLRDVFVSVLVWLLRLSDPAYDADLKAEEEARKRQEAFTETVRADNLRLIREIEEAQASREALKADLAAALLREHYLEEGKRKIQVDLDAALQKIADMSDADIIRGDL